MRKLLLILFASSLLWLTGCGNETLDGRWEQFKQVDSDGTVRKAKELDFVETIVFDGDEASQIVSSKDGSTKDITIKHTVEKISDTEYKLVAGGKIDFGTVYMKGNEFYLRCDTTIDEETLKILKENYSDMDFSELENMPEYTDYYYKKVK